MNQFKKPAGASCVKCLLVFTNTLIMLSAGVLLAIGYVLKFSTDLVGGYLSPLMKTLPTGGTMNSDVWSLFNYIAIAFITVGSVVIVLGIIGCVIGICPNKVILIAYIVAACLLAVGQIITGSIIYTGALDLKFHLLKNLVSNYASDTAKDEMSEAWNYAFVEFDCCGVDSYLDIKAADNWDPVKNINGTTVTMEIPVTCCMVPGKYPDYGKPADETCTEVPNTQNSYYQTGCLGAINNYIRQYSLLTVYCCGGMVTIEILGIILTVCLCQTMRHKKIKIAPSDTSNQ